MSDPVEQPQIGRYQVVASATDYLHVIVILDTATGRIWTRSVLPTHRSHLEGMTLLEYESQGKAPWEIPLAEK